MYPFLAFTFANAELSFKPPASFLFCLMCLSFSSSVTVLQLLFAGELHFVSEEFSSLRMRSQSSF